MVRTYRAEYATAITKLGRQRSPESVRSTHKALATTRDLGRRKDWEDFIAPSPATDWT